MNKLKMRIPPVQAATLELALKHPVLIAGDHPEAHMRNPTAAKNLRRKGLLKYKYGVWRIGCHEFQITELGRAYAEKLKLTTQPDGASDEEAQPVSE